MHNILVGTSAQLVLILFTLPLMDPHRNKPLLSYINVILVPGNIKATQRKKKKEKKGNKILSIRRLVIFNGGVKMKLPTYALMILVCCIFKHLFFTNIR